MPLSFLCERSKIKPVQLLLLKRQLLSASKQSLSSFIGGIVMVTAQKSHAPKFAPPTP